MKMKLILSVVVCVFCVQTRALAEAGDDNPTGVAGSYSGSITTGCSYDAYTGSASRQIDDIVLPGTGAYPLKWTRYWNSHTNYLDNFVGASWRFSYIDYYYTSNWPYYPQYAPAMPDGRTIPAHGYGVEESMGTWNGNPALLLADGGKVVFNLVSGSNNLYQPVQLIDPYGQITTIVTSGSGSGKTTKITEPGGRYLLVSYTSGPVSQVQAFDGVSSQPIQSVTYHWSTFTLADGTFSQVLDQVTYSDGTSATYTYTDRTYLGPCVCSPYQRQNAHVAILSTADDVRYTGPMHQIAYNYQPSGNGTRILSENHLVNGQAGEAISTITGLGNDNNPTITATETRGDGPTRTLTYYKSAGSVECPQCQGIENPDPRPTDGKIQTYTDFQGHAATLTYETDDAKPSAGFVTAVTDANNHTTTYTRSSLSWGILKITHPDGSHIDQTYTDEANPYYLASRTDENGHRTDYTRDSNNRITRKDYPADGNGVREYETFTYNNFGQIVTHRMRTGAYEHFAYDGSTSLTLPPGSRGLLTDKSNPTWTSDPAAAIANEPKTHYDYYTYSDYSGVWTDRVKAETDPRGLITQFDYDRTLDANGQNSGFSTAQTPVGGRGLVTRITHVSDSSNYQSFGFDKFGNKLWEENEVRDANGNGQRVTYTYDDYRRVLTVTNPLNQTLTNTYTPTNGTNTSPYVHTTNSVYTTTTPTGIVTKNIYDQNFRKTSTTQAYGTSLAATTTFAYDPVGNPTSVTDPLNHTTTTTYDTRNRKITVTDALNQQTQWFYDLASNVTSIQRADGTTETKSYDQMNRVLTDTVPQTNTINVTTTFTYYPGNVQYGGLPQQVIDADGHITTFTAYDPSGLKTTVTYPNGDTHGFTYDNDKNLISRRTVNGTTQNFTYDNRNRKITMVWTNPTNVSNFTAEWANFGYDAASRLTSAQNGIGAVGTGITSTITRQYDAAGHLILDRQNLNATLGNKDVQYAYDADGKDTRLYLTSAGYDYTFGYDAMGRFQTIAPTGGSVTFQYSYDAVSNEVERYNSVNTVGQFYTRDALDRLSERDVRLGSSVISSEAYGYDAMSRMLSVSREDGKTDAFTYYLDGELWTAQYAQPTPTPSATPTPPPNQCAPVTFSTTGGYPNVLKVYMSTTTTGATIFYTIGNSDYVTPTHNGSTPTGNTHVYTGPVSVAKNADKFFEAVAYKSGMTDSVFTEFEADNQGGGQAPIRMGPLSPGSSGRTVTYNIDQMGNRTSVVDTGVTTTYTQTAAGLNQYAQVGTNAVGNDNEHAMNSYQGNSYGYINDERLASVTSGGNTYYLVYDALGRCVKRTLNGATTYYIYDGEKPIVEYNSTGSILAKNLYGKSIDEILTRTDYSFSPAKTYYYQDDHEGSITHLTDATGAVVEHYRYDVFGAPSMEDGSGNSLTASTYNNRFMFTGREYTSTFGIYEYRARAYHPGLGRFTGEDPKGFDAGDYNLFRYCHNDPEDLTDPMGLDPMVPDEDLEKRNDIASGMNLDHYWAAKNATGFKHMDVEWGTTIWVGKNSGNRGYSKTVHGSMDGKSVTMPLKPKSKTPLAFNHVHSRNTFDHGGTESYFSPQDIWLADKYNAMTTVNIPNMGNGLQERFLPDKDPKIRGQFKGGEIQERDANHPVWHNKLGSKPDVNGWVEQNVPSAQRAESPSSPSSGLSRVNPFGAFQSSPFSDGPAGAQGDYWHPVPRALW